MKGLVYAGLLLNKTYFIVAGLVAAAGTALLSVMGNRMGSDPEMLPLISIFMLGIQFVVMTIVEEYLARDFEKNIKSRFADYVLAGMSKTKFVTAELLKNLISMAIAFAITVFMQLVFWAVNPGMIGADRILLLAALAIIIGLIDWISLPLVVYLKSAEKAGLIIGVILGFGGIMPIMIIFNLFENKWIIVMEFFSRDLTFFWVVGIGALTYALFYWILLNRVRRGDVC